MPDRAALDALITAIETELRDGYCFNRMDQARRALHNIRSAAREASAAVRRLAEQGEVYEVCDKDFMDEHPFGRCVALLLKGTTFEPEPGTRVRVTRIEEAP